LEVRAAHGKYFCPDCYQKYKARRLVYVLAGLIVLIALSSTWAVFAKPIAQFMRSVLPVGNQRMAVLFYYQKPKEEISRVYDLYTAPPPGTKPGMYRTGEDHAVPELADFFQREFQRYSTDTNRVLSLDVYGLYENFGPPPEPVIKGASTIANWKARHDFAGHFGQIQKKYSIPLDPYDKQIWVLIEPKSKNEEEFIESSQFVAGNRAYVKLPMIPTYAPDFYIQDIAVAIARLMGAELKLDPKGYPMYPYGYAAPFQNPRYPQQQCELMGCYVPVKPLSIERIQSLAQVIIGPKTAWEMGWTSKSTVNASYPKAQ